MSSFYSLLQKLKQSVTEISPDQAHEMIQDEPETALIDVRESGEWGDGHAAGAVHISRGFLELKIESAFPDKEQPIVLYCAGGTRSLFAADSLKKLGYRRVYSIATGYKGWKESGLPTMRPRMLSESERARYGRHLTIPEVGEEGQAKLIDAKVLMIGAGGLGCPAAFYLAAAGVGTLGIVDFDVVDESNLQRQILHTTERIGTSKVESAKKTLQGLNPLVNVVTYDTRISSANVEELFAGYDIIVDGTDNFPTRYLINDACVKLRKPNVHGSVFRFEGQVTVFHPGVGPCYRCLYPEPPPADLAPSCAEAGVLGVLPGVIGLLEAVETVKIILGRGETLVGRLLCYDALRTEFRELHLDRDPECSYCADGRTFPGFIDYEQFCRV
ncbi:MAG: molybdopterin-synthase adenylyltransferase MoeB [Myxococcales bacterium]|nr:molybdopterin-synthase adenylyltransferase MoeB [Myxococcales bacterium]